MIHYIEYDPATGEGREIDPFKSPDLVAVVRCRDCRWLDHHNLYLCMLPDGDGGYACWVVEPDGFCAWGERRVEGESE